MRKFFLSLLFSKEKRRIIKAALSTYSAKNFELFAKTNYKAETFNNNRNAADDLKQYF